jgi:porin
MSKTRFILFVTIALALPAVAAERPRFGGPDAVENQIEADASETEPIISLDLLDSYAGWKERVYEPIGLRFGGDYSVQGYVASESPGEDEAVGGMVRFFGAWELLDRGGSHPGALVWKVEHGDRYSDIPPSALGSELGYAGLFAAPFSDQRWRTTNLYWRQRFDEGRFTVLGGFLDATDYVDVYALASPWIGFQNLVFSTGSGSIPLPNDALLGVAGGAMLSDQVYAIASFGDANGDPEHPFEGFETFFDDHEFFYSLEAGWTDSQSRIASDNVHVTLWRIDERDDADTPRGWGINASATTLLADRWMPFLRAGWADEGGSLLEWSVGAGVGYQILAGRDQLGIGLNYGDPNADTFGSGRDDQWTAEVFYRWQVLRLVAVTPSVQWIVDSALNPDDDHVLIFGLRARFAL